MPRSRSQSVAASSNELRHLLVVDRVEKTEEANVVLVASQVLAIDLRGAAPDAEPVAEGREDHAFAVLEERILEAQAILHVHVQRTDIIGIAR